MKHTQGMDFTRREAEALVGRSVRSRGALRAYGLRDGTRGTVVRVMLYDAGHPMVIVRWHLPWVRCFGRRVPCEDMYQRWDWKRYIEG